MQRGRHQMPDRAESLDGERNRPGDALVVYRTSAKTQRVPPMNLLPLDIGSSRVEGVAERIISESPYVKLLTDPIHDGTQWRALANVEGMLCVIAVNISAQAGALNGGGKA